jgi:hypothetical protein
MSNLEIEGVKKNAPKRGEGVKKNAPDLVSTATLLEQIINEERASVDAAWHQLNTEREAAWHQLNTERESYEDARAKVGEITFKDRITLTVGGVDFVTSLGTLQRAQACSLFAHLFGNRSVPSKAATPRKNRSTGFPFEAEDDSKFYFDRDPTHFRHILNYLRGGNIVNRAYLADLPKTSRHELAQEALYYGITDLIALINPPKPLACKVSTSSSQSSGFFSWDSYLMHFNSSMPVSLASNQQTFSVSQKGLYRIVVRVNGSTGSANSDHIALHVNGREVSRSMAGLNTGVAFHS